MKDCSDEIITRAESVTIRVIDHARTTINNKSQLLMTAIDNLIATVEDMLNPVKQAQVAGLFVLINKQNKVKKKTSVDKATLRNINRISRN